MHLITGIVIFLPLTAIDDFAMNKVLMKPALYAGAFAVLIIVAVTGSNLWGKSTKLLGRLNKLFLRTHQPLVLRQIYSFRSLFLVFHFHAGGKAKS
jgi:hypothetical protein